MKLIWHIVWKDLTRLRWWLVLWVVALALPILDGVDLILHSPFPLRNHDWNRPNTHAGLIAIQIIVGYLIATLVWNEDRLAGTRQFWTTRPISGGRLFLAKVLAATAILWLVPVLVSLPWWLWCGFNTRQIALATFEAAQLAAALGIPVAMVAAMTDTLVRSLIWTAVLIVTVVPLFLTTLQGTHDVPLLGSRVLLIVALLLVEMLLVTVVRFWSRLRWWPIVVMGGAMIGSAVLAGSSGYVWFDRPGEWKPERAAAVDVAFDRATAKAIGPKAAREHPSSDSQDLVTAYFRVRAPGDSPGIVPLTATQQWLGSDGDDFMRPAGFGVLQALDIDGLRPIRGDSAPTRVSGPLQPVASNPDAKRVTEVFVAAPIRATMLERFHRAPPGYAAHLMLAQIRLRIADECPFQPGPWRAHDGYGLRIQTVDRSNGLSEVVLVSTSPTPMADVLLRWGWRGWLHGSFFGNLAVVNHETKEFQWVRGTKPVTLRVNGVEIAWRSEIVRAGSDRDGEGTRRPKWFDRAALAAITANTESIFARDISVPKFALSDDTK